VTAGAQEVLTWVSDGVDETRRAGQALGAACRGGEVILLEGPLGAGKTALAQGIAAGLDIAQDVTSPSFTILKEYRGRLALAHFDFYRVDAQRAVDLEFADYLGQGGVCVVEWASRVPQVVPADYLCVELRYAPVGTPPDTRLLRAWSAGPRHAALLAALRSLGGPRGAGLSPSAPGEVSEEDAQEQLAGAGLPLVRLDKP
jgi:tRNA threonylcarbamoyladenosine biosynthesis protein TsaE